MPISKSVEVFTDDEDMKAQQDIHSPKLMPDRDESAHERAQIYQQQELQKQSPVQQIIACILLFCPFLPNAHVHHFFLLLPVMSFEVQYFKP